MIHLPHSTAFLLASACLMLVELAAWIWFVRWLVRKIWDEPLPIAFWSTLFAQSRFLGDPPFGVHRDEAQKFNHCREVILNSSIMLFLTVSATIMTLLFLMGTMS